MIRQTKHGVTMIMLTGNYKLSTLEVGQPSGYRPGYHWIQFRPEGKKFRPSSAKVPKSGQCFLTGNAQYDMSAPRSIWIFEKILRIHEMASILVKVDDIFDIIIIFRIYHEFRKVTVDFVQVFLW